MKMKLKKLAPSRKPTTLAPAMRPRAKKVERQQRCLGPGLYHHEGGKQDKRRRQQAHGLDGAPALLWGSGDGIDQRHEASGDADRPEGVIAAPRRRQPALGHDAPSQRDHRGTDGDVQEEDVLPAGVASEHASGQQADGGGPRADAAPDAQSLVALGALGEHVHDDGQRGGQHERRPDALDTPHDDQEGVIGGEGAGERGPGEHRRARYEQTPAAQEVSGPPAEQQQPPEGERVSGDHPLQVSFGEMERPADGGQGDVDDRQVDDRHHEGHGQ